jgi:hypothetical protein
VANRHHPGQAASRQLVADLSAAKRCPAAILDRGKFIAAPTQTMDYVRGHHLGFPRGKWTPKSIMTTDGPSITRNLTWLAQRLLGEPSDFWVSLFVFDLFF